MHISHESIYHYVYIPACAELKRDWLPACAAITSGAAPPRGVPPPKASSKDMCQA